MDINTDMDMNMNMNMDTTHTKQQKTAESSTNTNTGASSLTSASASICSMEKSSIVSTKSLIDYDTSSESEARLDTIAVSVSTSKDQDQDSFQLKEDHDINHHNDDDDDAHTDPQPQESGDCDCDCSHQDETEVIPQAIPQANQEEEPLTTEPYPDREEDVSIPSLVDASDFDEEDQSQTSATSSLQSIKEGTAIGSKSLDMLSSSTSNLMSTSTRSGFGMSTASTSASAGTRVRSTGTDTADSTNSITSTVSSSSSSHHLSTTEQSLRSSITANEIQKWEDNRNDRNQDRYPNRSYQRGDSANTGNSTSTSNINMTTRIRTKDSDSPIVRKGLSDETVNTSNIVDMNTHNKDLFLLSDAELQHTGIDTGAGTVVTPQKAQHQQFEHGHDCDGNNTPNTQHQHPDNANVNTNTAISTNNSDESYQSSVFERSILYMTEFFSCSTPNIDSTKTTNSTATNGDDDATDESRDDTAKADTETELESQLQKLQTCIEIDILNIMGCSAEGAQRMIDSLGQSIFCQQCQCSYKGHTSKLCPKCNPTKTDATLNKPKIRNRNVYIRSKAAKRIRRLRDGGLSRQFSLSPVYTFLAEEIDVVHEESSAPRRLLRKETENGKKPDKGKRLMPLSKRPKALGGDSPRQTSIGGCSTSSQYEPTILATRSHDLSIDEELHENEEKKIYKREVQSDTCARMGSVVGERLLSRIFQSARDQRNYNNSPISEEDPILDDLYYDSDPGTHVGNVMGGKLELRKVVSKGLHGRSKSVGIVDGITTGLRRFEPNFLANKKSLLETLDVYTFDINDSIAISQLIRELIASSFAFIWHPNKEGNSWSDSLTAPPHRVKAWFEMGSCLKTALLQPKFVWRSNDNLKHSSRQMKVKSIHRPESVELLNIVRIVVPKEIDRHLHPFVKQKCAFTIVTNTEEEYLFETATQDERDKFVFAFKVMVARLASKIIVGDKDVFDEFFTPLGVAKKKKKRRRRRDRNKNSGVIFMDEVDTTAGSDSFSVTSESSSNIVYAIVGPVEEESNRTGELWNN